MFTYSFIIASYNGKEAILNCLKSLCVLDYPKDCYEIIIIDDSSSDGTVEALKEFKLKNLIIESINHRGAAFARNHGLQRSNNEIIIYLDQDVIVDPNLLKEYSRVFENTKISVIQGNIWRQLTDNRLTKIHSSWREAVFLAKTKLGDTPTQIDTIVTRNVAIRKAVLISVQEKSGYVFKTVDNSTGGEDRELGYRIHALDYAIQMNPNAIVKHKDPTDMYAIMKQKFYHAQGDVRQGIGEHFWDMKNMYRTIITPLKYNVPIWFSSSMWLSHILGAELQRLQIMLSYKSFKRIIDILGSLIGLIIGFPLLSLIYCLIKLDSKGPVIFMQTRMGKNKENFEMYKFRTMVVNAEEILSKDPKLLEIYKSNSYKIKNDPRVTRVGKFLRKSSLDELPQLLNILKGDMSIVGPRAYKPDEMESQLKNHPELVTTAEAVTKIKPGLTGIWQTSGRSNIGFDTRIKMDDEYARRASLLLDIWLILKTIPAVIKSRGAY